MNILITGASGKLGKEVVKLYPDALIPTHDELPIEDKDKVYEYIKNHKPNILIHLAAYTGPPRCEKNKELAWKINVDGTQNLINACRNVNSNCNFIYMSTPCEFEGDLYIPRDENCSPYPDNYYGLTKAIGSILVRASGLFHLIIRGNFVPYEKWSYPKAFTDRKGNYLFAHQLAKGIKEAVDSKQYGILHIVGNKVLSMYELAKRCPDSNDIQPYTLEEYYNDFPKSCKLTKNMVLGNTRNWKEYDIDEE